MADEPSWEDIFSDQPSPSDSSVGGRAGAPAATPPVPAAQPLTRRAARETASPARRAAPSQQLDAHGLPVREKPKRRRGTLWLRFFLVVVLGLGAIVGSFAFQPQIALILGLQPDNDYTGSGTGKVIITIEDGQIGSDVAKSLAAGGVTKSSAAFYSLLLRQKPPVTFKPGSYQLKSQMSAKAALAALVDPANRVSAQVVLQEGITLKEVLAKLAKISESTGVSAAQLDAAAADYRTFGLPAAAPSLEGYLFPATYTFEPGRTAHQMLQTFVTEMFARLDAAGVPVADRHRILTLAALTQKEGGPVVDYPQVARVWENRLAKSMNLQSDATVAYGVGSASISTSADQRADKTNRYNTYANPGLPIGPISNPGDKAIQATLHPASGSWLYFVVVNCSTGETAFSNTFAQHQSANAKLAAWLKANPGGCK